MNTQQAIARVRTRVAKASPIQAAVLGAGVSGQAAARCLEAQNASVRVLDDRTSAPIEAPALKGVDLCVLSPGIPRTHPALVQVEAPVVGEVELASWFARAPWVGITGTNGKSTTTELVGHILRADKRRVFVGGNLGLPACASNEEEAEVVVLELSSFQLESLYCAQFVVGAWLNLSADHLDRYHNEQAYADAKARLLSLIEDGGTCVASYRDPVVRQYVESASKDGRIQVRWFDEAEESFPLGLGLRGAHNRRNAAAAAEVCLNLGVSKAVIETALQSFEGLPHRLSEVAVVNGVRWFNDSKATNVAAAVTAVLAMDSPTYLIAGGRDKQGSWKPLVEAARTRVKGIFAVGEASSTISNAFGAEFPVFEVDTLERAVRRARSAAQSGEAVLLAPGCASLDQFSSYRARGEAFEKLVREKD